MVENAVQYSGHIQEFVPSNADWKRAILLSLLNEEAYKLLYNMCIPNEPENKPFKDIIKLMDNHFKPVVSIFSSREKFFEARKMANETPKEWAARLRNLVSVCNFGGTDEIEKALVNIFIIGYNSGSVKDRLYEEKETTTFLQVVEIASAKSVASPYCQGTVKQETEIHYAGSTSKKFTQARFSTSRNNSRSSSRASGSTAVASQNCKCTVCGRRNHKSDKCSYRDCYCHICNKKGHLAPMCSNKNGQNKNKPSSNRNNRNNFLESEDYSLYNLDCSTNPVSVSLTIENKPFTFSLGTGASYSVISDTFYEQNFKNLSLKPTDKVFIVYNGDKIFPLGFITGNVKYNGKSLNLNMFVINNGGPPLLGRDFFKLFELTIDAQIPDIIEIEQEPLLSSDKEPAVISNRNFSEDKAVNIKDTMSENIERSRPKRLVKPPERLNYD
ncbi:hypothetical protein NQ317_017209 [Molorchus minor]|uniref:CCHC-type domain-containing protein n=1 Tax=Molorchus minor TaxID=1323400 RepID=A0ABQ9JWZ0_9CUCU|nr:hypothetical protein NQ317_017209 [Molorchus minor]